VGRKRRQTAPIYDWCQPRVAPAQMVGRF